MSQENTGFRRRNEKPSAAVSEEIKNEEQQEKDAASEQPNVVESTSDDNSNETTTDSLMPQALFSASLDMLKKAILANDILNFILWCKNEITNSGTKDETIAALAVFGEFKVAPTVLLKTVEKVWRDPLMNAERAEAAANSIVLTITDTSEQINSLCLEDILSTLSQEAERLRNLENDAVRAVEKALESFEDIAETTIEEISVTSAEAAIELKQSISSNSGGNNDGWSTTDYVIAGVVVAAAAYAAYCYFGNESSDVTINELW